MPTFGELPRGQFNLALLGKIRMKPTNPDRPPGIYVIQRVLPGLGNITWDKTRHLQLRVHVPHNPSHTYPQQVRRELFRAAVKSYQMLSPAEKLQWRGLRGYRNLPGYCNYISAFMAGTIHV